MISLLTVIMIVVFSLDDMQIQNNNIQNAQQCIKPDFYMIDSYACKREASAKT